MRSYIIKPKSVKKNEIVSKYYSFLPSEHRKVEIYNKNQEAIQNLVAFEEVGSQIDVQEYLTFDSRHYLGTISCMNSLIYDEIRGEKISPNIYKKSSKKIKKGDIIISRNASLGKIAFVNNESKVILNGGLSLLRFQEKYKYYATAFFIVEYGAEYLICLTSGGGTQQNAKRQNLLDVPIPFPTTVNHSSPEKIENLVSFIVQNIIDKEEQVKLKNKQIDSLIERELTKNQKVNNFTYKYPRISEIQEETRVDTGLYGKEFKQIDFLIKNYQRGREYLKDLEINFKSGETPKTYLENENGKYIWVSNKDFRNNVWKNFTKINTLNIKNLVPKNCILISRRAPAGINQVIVEKQNVIVNDGIKIITINKITTEKLIFISLFFNSDFYYNILRQLSGGGVFGGMTNEDISNMNFPNFPEFKQQEIAKLYYNKLDKNKDLTLENYLEKEQMRNSKVGIFQLNMEIFTLRGFLEDLVDKIINNQNIDIKKYLS